MSSDPPMRGRPVVLLTFANDRAAGGEGYLRELAEEQRRLEDALDGLRERFEVVSRSNTRVDDLYRLFARYNDRIVVFHYGGHARPDALMFEDDDQGPVEARIAGLAERLGALPHLSLIFLNGCSTGPQVDVIRAHARAPVVATEQAIVDAVARDFAHRFYDDLAEGRSIDEAFSGAESRIKATVDLEGARRMMRPEAPPESKRWPWALHVDPTAEPGAAWRLADAAAAVALPPWKRPGVLGALVVGLAVLLVWALLRTPTPAPIAVDAGLASAIDAAGAPPADPMASPYAAEVFDHLLERARAGEPRAAIATSVTDAHRWTLWRLASMPWTAPDAGPLQRALIEEGLRRLYDERPAPSVDQLERVGRLYRGIQMLRLVGQPLAPDEADALRDRVGETMRAIWPLPAGRSRPAIRLTMIPAPGLGGVALGETEVTNGQLRALIPDYAPGRDPRLPVDGVDWFVARAFAGWLDARLPTRGEFARVHRWMEPGGPCRSVERDIGEIAWYRGNTDRVMEVGRKPPCQGIYDLRGNVSEWALDPELGGRRFAVTAGGRFDSPADVVTRRHTDASEPDRRAPGHGFRLALDPEHSRNPLASPRAGTVMGHLVARAVEGVPPADLARSVVDGRAVTLWMLVSSRWARPETARRPIVEALVDEGLRRLAAGEPPVTVAALRRYGRLLRAVDRLEADAPDPLPAADADALRRRIIAALRAARPLPPGASRATLRGAMVPLETDGGARVAFGATEVTVEDVARFAPDYTPPLGGDRPATGVDWYTARAYAAWLGARLPTRVEFAAAIAALEPGGACRADPGVPLSAMGRIGESGTARVASLKPCLGLYDVVGNVREWLLEPHPELPAQGLVGGSGYRSSLANAERFRTWAVADDNRPVDVGFRLALDLAPPE